MLKRHAAAASGKYKLYARQTRRSKILRGLPESSFPAFNKQADFTAQSRGQSCGFAAYSRWGGGRGCPCRIVEYPVNNHILECRFSVGDLG